MSFSNSPVHVVVQMLPVAPVWFHEHKKKKKAQPFHGAEFQPLLEKWK